MNPELLLAWGDDDEGGRTHLEAAIDEREALIRKCDGETDAEPESMAGFMERITWKLIPENGANHKTIVLNTLLFLYHLGQFPNETLATLAKRFHVTKAGLYRRNTELYGRGFGVERRGDEGRENMRRARLRCIKNTLGQCDSAESEETKKKTIKSPNFVSGVKNGGEA